MKEDLAILLLRFMEHALVERCQYDNCAMAAALLADVQGAMNRIEAPLAAKATA